MAPEVEPLRHPIGILVAPVWHAMWNLNGTLKAPQRHGTLVAPVWYLGGTNMVPYGPNMGLIFAKSGPIYIKSRPE